MLNKKSIAGSPVDDVGPWQVGLEEVAILACCVNSIGPTHVDVCPQGQQEATDESCQFCRAEEQRQKPMPLFTRIVSTLRPIASASRQKSSLVARVLKWSHDRQFSPLSHGENQAISKKSLYL